MEQPTQCTLMELVHLVNEVEPFRGPLISTALRRLRAVDLWSDGTPIEARAVFLDGRFIEVEMQEDDHMHDKLTLRQALRVIDALQCHPRVWGDLMRELLHVPLYRRRARSSH